LNRKKQKAKRHFTTEARRAQRFFFKNREMPIFENRSACGTQGTTIPEATGWIFFGGISRQRKTGKRRDRGRWCRKFLEEK
jgi:hypothetical protein